MRPYLSSMSLKKQRCIYTTGNQEKYIELFVQINHQSYWLWLQSVVFFWLSSFSTPIINPINIAYKIVKHVNNGLKTKVVKLLGSTSSLCFCLGLAWSSVTILCDNQKQNMNGEVVQLSEHPHPWDLYDELMNIWDLYDGLTLMKYTYYTQIHRRHFVYGTDLFIFNLKFDFCRANCTSYETYSSLVTAITEMPNNLTKCDIFQHLQ